MFNPRNGAAAVLIVLVLAGCTPDPVGGNGAPTDSATPSSSPAPTAAPTPTMPAFADDQIVILITATATAPNGATLDVAMTTYYPVEADSPEGVQIQDYLAFAGSSSEVADPDFIKSKKAILQVSKLTATAVEGSWPGDAGVLPSLGPGVTDTIVDIPAGPVQGNRLSITGPGSGYGVTAIYSQDGSATDTNGWAERFTYYGFNDAFAGTTLSNCSAQLLGLAGGSRGIGAFQKHNCFLGVGD